MRKFSDGDGVPLERAGEAFVSQMDATVQLLQLASESDERVVEFEAMKDGLSDEQLEELTEGWRAVAQIYQQELDAREAGEPAEVTFDFNTDDPAVAAALHRLLVGSWHRSRMPGRSALLRRSVLLLAVSNFEVLLGQVMREALNDKPGQAGLGDASISLAELEGLEDVAAARQLIIERKVDSLLRKASGRLESLVRAIRRQLERHGR